MLRGGSEIYFHCYYNATKIIKAEVTDIRRAMKLMYKSTGCKKYILKFKP
jgi:hypothetical protein